MRRISQENGPGVSVIVNDMANSTTYIVGGDSEYNEILAIIPEGISSCIQLPEACEDWLQQITQAMGSYINTHNSDRQKAYIKSGGVAPLLSTRWGQGSPYNSKISDNMTGCVATAMAQIMNYHKYPSRGVGQIEYEWDGEIYSMSFSNVSFNWNQMLDDYSDPGITEGQIEAVAELMKAAGHSVETMYGLGASGSYSSSVAPAMTKYFGYSPNAVYVDRRGISDEKWESMIVEQLDNGIPIYMSGKADSACCSSGHAYVCDGYTVDGLFHFNWGWEGEADGWYVLSIGRGLYTYFQDAVFNLVPPSHSIPEGVSLPWVTKLDISKDGIGDMLNIDFTLDNKSNYVSNLNLGLLYKLVEEDSEYSYIEVQNGISIMSSETYENSVNSVVDLPDGEYEVRLGSMEGLITSVLPAKGAGASEYRIKVESGHIQNIIKSSNENISVSYLVFDSTPIENIPASVTLKLRNSGLIRTLSAADYSIYMADKTGDKEDEKNEIEIKSEHLYGHDFEPTEEKEHVIEIPPLEAGKYRIEIFDYIGRMDAPYNQDFTVYSADQQIVAEGFEGVIIDDSSMQVISPDVNRSSRSGGLDVTIPSSVVYNGKEYKICGVDPDFYKDRNLKNLTIKAPILTNLRAIDGLTKTRLEKLALPEGLTAMETQCMQYNEYLQSCILPSTIQKIGENVFEYCESIEELIVLSPNPPFEVSVESFSQSQKHNITLIVPDESVGAYRKANVWKEFSNIVGLNQSRIGKITESNFTIRNIDNGFIIEVPDFLEWNIFDLSGRLIANGKGPEKLTGLSGVCIIRTAGLTRKIISK